VHEATGVVQSQASKLYSQGKDQLASSGVADRLRGMGGKKDEVDERLNDRHQHMSPNSF